MSVRGPTFVEIPHAAHSLAVSAGSTATKCVPSRFELVLEHPQERSLRCSSPVPRVTVEFAHSEVAGQWTTLARNSLTGVVVFVYASCYARTEDTEPFSVQTILDGFLTFALGFLGFVVLASSGFISPTVQAVFGDVSDWLFLLVFVGLGTEIRFSELHRAETIPH